MNLSESDFDFVLAIDPGGTTGVAWHVAQVPLVDSTQVPGGAHGFFAWFLDIARTRPPTLLIVEDFIITSQTARKTPQPDALRIIGALDWWAWEHNVPLLLPPPSDKSFGTDTKLKALGWYKPGQGHGNDALRHLLNQLGPELRYPPMIRRLQEISEDL